MSGLLPKAQTKFPTASNALAARTLKSGTLWGRTSLFWNRPLERWEVGGEGSGSPWRIKSTSLKWPKSMQGITHLGPLPCALHARSDHALRKLAATIHWPDGELVPWLWFLLRSYSAKQSILTLPWWDDKRPHDLLLEPSKTKPLPPPSALFLTLSTSGLLTA